MDEYSNREKLMAVLDYWMKPLVAQLPPQMALLSPLVKPIVRSALNMMSDEAIPMAAKAVVDNAVKQGGVQIWNVRLDHGDLCELQRLINLNIPCDDERASGYGVLT